MKKTVKKAINIMLLLFLFLFLITILFHRNDNSTEKNRLYLSFYLNIDEINYIINSDIDIEDVKPYLEYNNFNVYNFFSYERLRIDYDLTYLESINYYNHPNYYKFYSNPKPALFMETSLTLVNKCFFLDKDFIPFNLVNVRDYDVDYIVRDNDEILLKREVMEHYLKMYKAAKQEGIELYIFSGYRSYKKQEHLYNEVYKKDNSISAKPGFSEHQTGYAIDISKKEHGLTSNFAFSNTYKWLVNNCYKYGFILRYPDDKEDKTGYQFEPWHFRYVGNIASDIYFEEHTLEEYIFSNLEI